MTGVQTCALPIFFAYDSDFMIYNNDANRHIRYYRNTFQHGGISMEEMIVPYIVLEPKK